ncbi:MAG: hypothetical protein IJY65_03855 [Clostridia bacterium]|nr:hypothetical protein [Clostridia bacterium]
MESYLGEQLSVEEYDYLSKFGDLTLAYNPNIPSSYVRCATDGGTLSVIAESYSYTAANGATVIWTPKVVTYGGERVDAVLHDEYYIADFAYDEASVDPASRLIVEYSTEFIIKKESLNLILNKAYVDGAYYSTYIKEQAEEYKVLIEQYKTQTVLYDKYLVDLAKYQADYLLYEEYLLAKSDYDIAKSRHEKYIADLAEYERQLALYSAYRDELEEYRVKYTEYSAYLEKLNAYNAAVEKNADYLATMQLIADQITIFESVKWKQRERTIYHAILGDSVTQALTGNKSQLISSPINADPALIDMAGEATENIREHFAAYFELEGEKEKYAYYSVNYEAIKNDFRNLLIALDSLYANKKIRGTIISMYGEERKEKYCILVCQLAMLTQALWDGEVRSYDGTYVYDANWKIENRTIVETLGTDNLLEDKNNATPVASGYPATIPVMPEDPGHMDEPVRPTVVYEPTAPEYVSDPGEAPAAVEEPEALTPVAHPGDEPVEYIPEREVSALAAAHEAGGLVSRPLATESYVYKVSSTVSKTPFNSDTVTVFFLDDNGEFICSTEADRGTYAEFSGTLPTRAEDDRAVYTFSHWVDSAGNPPDLSSVQTNLILHPAFDERIKTYKIEWIVEGVSYYTEAPYGDIPSFDGTPKKADDDFYEYNFARWNTEPVAVVGEASYTAVFDKEYIVSHAGGGASVTVSDGVYTVDLHGAILSGIDVSRVLLRAGSSGVRIIADDAEIRLSSLAVRQLNQAGAVRIDVKNTTLLYGRRAYTVTFSDGTGAPVSISERISVNMQCGDFADVAILYYEGSPDERVKVKYTKTGGRVEFSAMVGVRYVFTEEYSVELIESTVAELSIDKNCASPGELVSISAVLPAGMKVASYYIVDSEGIRKTIDGSTFQMPTGSVMVGAVCAPIEYVVNFVVDGVVISTVKCYYGETVSPPQDPKKSNDGVFSYKFIGWSSDMEPIVADTVYTARFEADLLPPKEEVRGLSATMKKLLTVGLSFASVVFFAVVPATVLGVVFVRKYRRQKIRLPHTRGE